MDQVPSRGEEVRELEFAIGALVGGGIVLAAWFAWWRKIRNTNIDLPLDSLITFALYDHEGNELTERTLVSVGLDGRNARPIVAPVIRNGAVHHGVVFIGECGSVLDMVSGEKYLTVGDQYVILPGNWNTNLNAAPSE